MKQYKNFINNEFVDAQSDKYVSVDNPANGKLIAEVPLATYEDAMLAVDSAAKAQKQWRKLTTIERSAYLQRLADALIEYSDEIGQALANETGKSLPEATNEAVYASEITRYHAEWARRIEGEVIPSDSPSENLLLQREPIGVAACLIPFNFPVYTLLRKIAPALITGNTVVVRPSNNTPCSAFEIAKAIVKAEFPAGVISILTMDHAIAEAVCTHQAVGIITLTGSVAAGRKVLEYSQKNIAKSSLELGGKSPAIVAADADLEKAAQDIVNSRVSNCGQLCTAIERVYVHESVHDQFVDLLRTNVSNRRFGDRAENPDFMGPLISESARSTIQKMVDTAVNDGAVIEVGGSIPDGVGYFYPPTLLTNCRQDMEIVREEIFGSTGLPR